MEDEYCDLSSINFLVFHVPAHRVLGSLGLQRLLDIEVDRYMNGHEDDPPGPEDTPRSRAVLDHLVGPSELQPEKSDLNKKLDAVFNNIRQNKLREEHQALAFQRTGKSRKRKKSKKSVALASGSSGDEVTSNRRNSKRNQKKSRKSTPKAFSASDSDSDSFEALTSPAKPVKNPTELSQLNTNRERHGSKDDRHSTDSGHDNMSFSVSSSKSRSAPTEISKKTFLNQSIFAADDSDSDNETQTSKIRPSSSPITTNVSSFNQSGSHKRATEDLTNTNQAQNVKSTFKFQAKTPVSTKTISKLKTFAFKETKKTNDQKIPAKQNSTPAETSSSNIDHNASSEELFNTTLPKNSSSGNALVKTNSTSTQSSIFCVGDDDQDSDYELWCSVTFNRFTMYFKVYII